MKIFDNFPVILTVTSFWYMNKFEKKNSFEFPKKYVKFFTIKMTIMFFSYFNKISEVTLILTDSIVWLERLGLKKEK